MSSKTTRTSSELAISANRSLLSATERLKFGDRLTLNSGLGLENEFTVEGDTDSIADF